MLQQNMVTQRHRMNTSCPKAQLENWSSCICRYWRTLVAPLKCLTAIGTSSKAGQLQICIRKLLFSKCSLSFSVSEPSTASGSVLQKCYFSSTNLIMNSNLQILMAGNLSGSTVILFNFEWTCTSIWCLWLHVLVFKSKRSEMEFVIQKDGSDGQNIGNSDAVVRLRGLPFSCTHEDIMNFFKGRFCYS